MAERHVAQRQQQQQARQRQFGVGREAERDDSEQPYLQRLKFLEIRALPLTEGGLQRRHRDQLKGLEEAGDAVWRDECYSGREQGEYPPAPRLEATASARQDGLGAEKERQAQAKHKAAVQVGP